MTALEEQQTTFALLIAQFIQWVFANGWQITLGEAWRSPTEADIDAHMGSGIANSLHCERLAFDLNLWKDGILLGSVEDYRPLGEHWCGMHSLARWGGHFSKPDADHFSMTFNGVS